MKRKSFFISLLLLLWLTACTIILPSPIVIIREQLGDSTTPSQTATAIPSSTATINPTATPSPTAANTATPSQVQAITLERLNVRAGSGTSFSIVGVLPVGQTVFVLGRNTDSSWLQIGESRWISAQFVTISGNLNSLPVIVPPTPEPTPTREILGQTRISYNVNGEAIPDRAYLTSHLQRLCPTTVLIMNNLSYAVELYNLLHQRCGTIVISRSWSPLEGSEWFYRSPQNFVAQWQREGHPEIVRYGTNEPSFGGNQPISQFVAAEIELMRLARASGFTVAMGNFSVGYFQPEQINSGGFDAYLRGLNQYGHYLAVHEYACCALPFGVGQWQVEALLDRTRVQPVSWPLAQALPVRLWNGELPPYWYLRRADWFLLRADVLGINRPRILVTEFAWDNLPNIKSHIEPLRQQFGLDRYFDDMRGVNTYPNLWRYYWPQWDFAQAACEQLKWAERIYPPEYLGFNMFTWSLDWQQTDFSGRENPAMFQLHICLERYSNSLN